MVGTGMLWVGWYGFNAGSAGRRRRRRRQRLHDHHARRGRRRLRLGAISKRSPQDTPSILGFCSGAVAGLVVITPACRLRRPPPAR